MPSINSVSGQQYFKQDMMARGGLILTITLFSFMAISVAGLRLTHEADRPSGFGLTAELKEKTDAKFDRERAQEACQWIDSVLSRSVSPQCQDPNHVRQSFKDGVALDRLINFIQPGSVKTINHSKMSFKQMENIGNFIDGCQNLGVAKSDLFQTVDLFDGQNIPQFINAIYALERTTRILHKGLPKLGPQEVAPRNPRQFSEQQLRAGQGVIGMQMGTNKFATQAGQNFGKARAILD